MIRRMNMSQTLKRVRLVIIIPQPAHLSTISKSLKTSPVVLSQILQLPPMSSRPPQLHFDWWVSHHCRPRSMRLQRYMVYLTCVWPLLLTLATLIVQWKLLRRCKYGLRSKSSSESIMIGSRLSCPRVFWPPLLQNDCLTGNMISLLLAKQTKVIGLQMVSQVCFVVHS